MGLTRIRMTGMKGHAKSRKAQMEMIGIALVVVLVVIGMAFVFRALIKPASTAQATFAKEQESQNILLAMGRSVSTCRNMDLTELIQDCANYVDHAADIPLPGGAWGGVKCIAGNGMEISSCDYVNDSIRYIFNRTLEKRNLPYRFFVYKTSYKDPILKMEFSPSPKMPKCSEKSIKIYPIYYDVENPGELTLPLSMGGVVNVKLDVCTPAKKG